MIWIPIGLLGVLVVGFAYTSCRVMMSKADLEAKYAKLSVLYASKCRALEAMMNENRELHNKIP